MRIVKVGVLAPTNKGIPLGVQGENRATEVEFDTRPWFREYPSGTVSAVARRNGDPAPYPLTLDVADGTAVWHVSDTDSAKAGEGAVELTMTSAGARVRSLTFKTLVTASLTDAPVDDDAWYGWLDKAVVKVDETVQSAQRKMDEVDLEWNELKADVTEKVDECAEVAAQAASDAHHAKVDAQATAKALESANGSVAKAEAAANRAVDAALEADDSAVEASRSALSAGESAEAASGSATSAATSASEAVTSASNAADAASAASGSASAAEQSATDASNAKAEAQTAKSEAEVAKSEAATSASNAAASATAAAKSASDAAASVDAINVIVPTSVDIAPTMVGGDSIAIGSGAKATDKGNYSIVIGSAAHSYSIGNVVIGPGASDTIDSKGQNVILGDHATVSGTVGSIVLGSYSKVDKDYEMSIGNVSVTREITHVSEPTATTSASTKKYTDDNDAKTLTEAKKYTDANTSNALVGTVSGKLLHVEDAWPSKPMSLTIDGACKQDGTPSPENPVPIEVIENPVLWVAGKNLLDYQSWKEYVQNNGTVRGTCDFGDDGTFTITATEGDTYTSYDAEQFPYIAVVHGKEYTLSWSADSNKSGQIYVFFNGVGANNVLEDNSISNKLTFTTPSDCSFITFRFGVLNPGDAIKYSNVQIELGSTATDYEQYVGASLPITLPAEHPYLAKLPDGTCDTIEIDKDGNVSLVASVLQITVPETKWTIQEQNGGFSLGYISVPSGGNDVKKGLYAKSLICDRLESRHEWENAPCFGVSEVLWVVPRTNQSDITSDDVAAVATGMIFYAPLATPFTYPLGKTDIPSLPETISNVWTDAELTTNMSMTYKRDINVAFDNLVQAVVAAAAGE